MDSEVHGDMTSPCLGWKIMAAILVNVHQMLDVTEVTDDVNFRCNPVILGQRSRMCGGPLRDRA